MDTLRVRIALGLLLLLEAYFGASWVARLIPVLGIYEALTLFLIVARAFAAAALGTAGWMLIRRALPAAVFAQVSLLMSAVLLTFELGAGLSPSSLFPTFKWPAVAAYWAYASVAILWLRRRGASGRAAGAATK